MIYIPVANFGTHPLVFEAEVVGSGASSEYKRTFCIWPHFAKIHMVPLVWTGVGLSLQNTTREGESGKEEDIAMDIWICWARKTIKMSSNAKASANKGTIYYPAIV